MLDVEVKIIIMYIWHLFKLNYVDIIEKMQKR